MWKSLSALLYTAVGVVVRAAPIHGDSVDWGWSARECYKVGLYTVYTSTVRKFITEIFSGRRGGFPFLSSGSL